MALTLPAAVQISAAPVTAPIWTAVAERSVDTALDGLKDWPEKVRLMQANWIGQSRGIELDFPMVTPTAGLPALTCYSTRPDTLRAATFMAIAPEHPLARALAVHDPKIAAFAEECRKGGTSAEAIETAEKLGLDTGLTVRHPIYPDRELSI